MDVRVDPREVDLDPVSREWLDEEGTFTARKNVPSLREFAAKAHAPTPRRRIELRFLRSPVEIRGTSAVEAAAVRRNQIVRTDGGAPRAQPLDEQVETFECGLALRSVGYRAVPLPDVPFDERSFVLPNERGRVLSPDAEPIPGVYAVGWIKRGPTGILGTNKRDAEETTGCPAVEDLRAGRLPPPPKARREQIDALLAERKPNLVTIEGWRAIDTHEVEGGRAAPAPPGKAGIPRRAAGRGRGRSDRSIGRRAPVSHISPAHPDSRVRRRPRAAVPAALFMVGRVPLARLCPHSLSSRTLGRRGGYRGRTRFRWKPFGRRTEAATTGTVAPGPADCRTPQTSETDSTHCPRISTIHALGICRLDRRVTPPCCSRQPARASGA